MAVNLINGLFGNHMKAIFENIKDKDSYLNEVSNLNKYGAGQETWDDYYSNSISGTAAAITTKCWLLWVPALMIIIFRILGLHKKPIFDKVVEIKSRINQQHLRYINIGKQVLMGLFMFVMFYFTLYLCSTSQHQTHTSHVTLCEIAKFSDTIIFGNVEHENWVGTQNLTKSADIISKETDKIYEEYQNLFWSSKYDWNWVSDFKSKINSKLLELRALTDFKFADFDGGQSKL